MTQNRSAVILFALFIVVIPAVCYAQDNNKPAIYAIGPSLGTLGIGAEASLLIRNSIVLRGSASFLDVNAGDLITSFGGSADDYNFETQGVFAGAMIDWHPGRSGWRLTSGLRYVDLEFNDRSTDGGTIGLNGYSFLQVGAINTRVSNNNPLAPYFGFGYDTTYFSRAESSFVFGIDIGALYAGTPKVKITTDSTVGGLDADIAIETAQLKDDLDTYYRFYPVVMLSGKFNF